MASPPTNSPAGFALASLTGFPLGKPDPQGGSEIRDAPSEGFFNSPEKGGIEPTEEAGTMTLRGWAAQQRATPQDNSGRFTSHVCNCGQMRLRLEGDDLITPLGRRAIRNDPEGRFGKMPSGASFRIKSPTGATRLRTQNAPRSESASRRGGSRTEGRPR